MTSLQGTAVWFTGPRKVELRTAPLPSVGPGQIKVRALFSAISHGTERLAYRGEIDPLLPLDLPTFQGSFRYPLKYGYACTGVVEEVGPQVIGIEPGNLVFALHPHQDRFVLDASLVTTLPQNVDPVVGRLFRSNRNSSQRAPGRRAENS